ncbi:MAG: family 14 glycosylhydrolase [bacterium]
MKAEIIHQWQLIGPPHPPLLKDEVLEDAVKLGITSLESYFFWSEIEKEPGKFDFSSYDVLVEKLKRHNLKWVPFLILGPSYGTPQWFKKSNDSVFCKCLEHQKESGNQSIWNPNLPRHVERFLAKTAEHYQDKEIIESVILGISGNWGEAIYTAGGFSVGNFHTHTGFWSADKYAKESFVNFALEKYGDLESVNRAWVADFKDIKEINFPSLKQENKRRALNFILDLGSKSPKPINDLLKNLRGIIFRKNKKAFFLVSDSSSQPAKTEKPEDKQCWLDFVNWYLGSMTKWADFWLEAARKHFPNNKIYLVTGGTGNPVLGADFVGQAKAAKKRGAGIRITNQTNDYAQSFILTRLASSACRFYGAPLTTEEEGILQTAEGVTMRIFDAITTGADGFYCKNLISQGNLLCMEEDLPIGRLTPGAKNMEKYRHLFDLQKPIIKTAVFFPNSSIALRPELVTILYNRCARLRDILDFDLVDEQMIEDGALEKYQSLLVLEGELPKEKIPSHVKIFYDPAEIKNEIDAEYDGVYATRFPDKILYYNSNNKKIKKNAPFLQRSFEMEPNSVISIKL